MNKRELIKLLDDMLGTIQAMPLSIFSAVEEYNLQEVKNLINKEDKLGGLKVNSESELPTHSPLHIATVNDDIEIVKMLLDRGANINARNKYGATPLYYAINRRVYSNYEIIKMLLEHGANVDIEDKTGQTALLLAVKKGCLPIVQLILKYNPEVNKKGNQLSFYIAINCAGKEYSEIINNLLQYGFSLDRKCATITKLQYTAVRNGHLNIVEILLNYGVNVNSPSSKKFLHIAAQYKYEKIAALLIKSGADVNAKDEYLRTPIFYAIESRDLEIIKLFLTIGADINVKDRTGKTPILYSSGANMKCYPESIETDVPNERKEIIELLWQHGADITASDENGDTALHFTALNNYDGSAKELLRFGADVDATNKNGRTALHLASKEKYKEIIGTLLEHGSDINIIDKTNMTPFEYAVDNDFSYLILKEHINKMKTANLYLNSKNLQSISNDGGNKFEDKCKKELESMKIENIVDNKISYHDILLKNQTQLANYAKNESVVNVLTSDDYKKKFPIYYHLIKNNFRKGMERKDLLEEINKFIIFPELPYDCTENVLSYLSNNDLKQFCTSFAQ